MQYTPRQVAAFAFLARSRTRRQALDSLNLQRLATHGDKKAYTATVEEMERE